VVGSDTWFLGYSDPGLARDHLRPSEEDIHGKIVPALRAVLAAESDNDLVTGALVALAKIGESPGAGPGARPIAETIVPFLAAANQEVAETAAVALGILGDPAAVDLLSQLLRDTPEGRKHVGRGEVHWRTRAFAAYGLGLIGHRARKEDVRRVILEILRQGFEEGSSSMATPDVAVACLMGFGLVPLELDTPCPAQGSRPPTATQCRHGQVRWLLEVSERPGVHSLVRAHVPTILARLVRGPGVQGELRDEVAQHLLNVAAGGPRIRRERQVSAMIALGQMGTGCINPVDQRIAKALIKACAEARQPQVRTLALVSLGQIAGRRGQGAVDVESVAKIRSFLLDRLVNGRSTDRAWVALALGLQVRSMRANGEPTPLAAVKLLRRTMKDAKSPREVGAYAVALGIMQDVEAAELLVSKLEVIADDRALGYVCLGLGLMNARQGVSELRTLLEKSRYRPLLLSEVAIALGLLGDKDVIPALLKQLRQAKSLTAQSSIASALGAIGDARSVDPLLVMLKDPRINVRGRAFAAVALGIVADKEPLPWNAKIAVGANYLAGTPTLSDGQGAGILDIF